MSKSCPCAKALSSRAVRASPRRPFLHQGLGEEQGKVQGSSCTDCTQGGPKFPLYTLAVPIQGRGSALVLDEGHNNMNAVCTCNIPAWRLGDFRTAGHGLATIAVATSWYPFGLRTSNKPCRLPMVRSRFLSAFGAVLPEAMTEYIAEVEVQKLGRTKAHAKARGQLRPKPLLSAKEGEVWHPSSLSGRLRDWSSFGDTALPVQYFGLKLEMSNGRESTHC